MINTSLNTHLRATGLREAGEGSAAARPPPLPARLWLSPSPSRADSRGSAALGGEAAAGAREPLSHVLPIQSR